MPNFTICKRKIRSSQLAGAVGGCQRAIVCTAIMAIIDQKRTLSTNSRSVFGTLGDAIGLEWDGTTWTVDVATNYGSRATARIVNLFSYLVRLKARQGAYWYSNGGDCMEPNTCSVEPPRREPSLHNTVSI